MENTQSFCLQDLLAEAKAMDAIVLPPEVRIQLTGFNVVRLRLLATRNVLAAMKWAAQNPVRFDCFWMHYLNPEMTQKDIAGYVGVKAHSVRDYLKAEIIPDSVWDQLPKIEG